jgi:dihydrofolate reductase
MSASAASPSSTAAAPALLGRVTYDGFAPVWPRYEDEFADKFNSMPKYVISSTLENPEWNNTTVRGDVVEQVTKPRPRRGGSPLARRAQERR